MKRTLSLATLALTVLMSLNLATGFSARASEPNEIQRLIETATTAENHTKIEEYYETQAEKFEAKARFHASEAKWYSDRNKPLLGIAKHCSNLSEEYTDKAKEFRAKAMEQRQIAEETATK